MLGSQIGGTGPGKSLTVLETDVQGVESLVKNMHNAKQRLLDLHFLVFIIVANQNRN